MKILNINSYYYSSSVHKQLQNALHRQGLDSLTYVPLARGYIPRDECHYGNEDHVEISKCYNELDRYIFHVKHNKILVDIKRRINLEKFDCLHAHSLFSNGYIALKIKEKLGTPYVVAVRDTDLNTFFKYMVHLRRLGQRILRNADKIVFLSEPYRDYLIQNYIPKKMKKDILSKSEIIPNGIDAFWLKNRGAVKKIKDKKMLKLIHVGVISKRKNLNTTVRAVEILKNKGYNVIFTVVGKIVDKSIFEQIRDLPYINYASPMPKEQLIEVYRSNDVLVMPSITETFGLVYAEAMSQGLPVIYTRGQGFDGHFNEGEVGYSVQYNSAEEIVERIKDILDNYEAISNSCITKVDRFDWSKIAKSYHSIYEDVL